MYLFVGNQQKYLGLEKNLEKYVYFFVGILEKTCLRGILVHGKLMVTKQETTEEQFYFWNVYCNHMTKQFINIYSINKTL